MGPPPFALVESKVSFLSFAKRRRRPPEKKGKKEIPPHPNGNPREGGMRSWDGGENIFLPFPSGVFCCLPPPQMKGGGRNRAVQEDSAMDAAGIKKEGGGGIGSS